MANEVTLNTRIQLKRGTLAQWQAVESTFKPLAGELIIYEVPTGNTSITNPPATLMKVGDGTNFLKDLKYVAACSADVASFLKTDSTGATWTEAKFTAWIKSLIDISDVDTSAFALDADLQQAVKDLQAEVSRAKAAEEKALTDAKVYTDEKDQAMDLRMDEVEAKKHEHSNKALLDTYTQTEANLADAVAKKHEHANKAELDKIAAGDKAKWDAMEQNAKDYADGLDEAMDGRMQAVEAKFGDGEGTVEAQIAAAVAAEKQRAEGIEGGLRTDVDAIKGDYLKAADKKSLQDQITTNANAIERLTNGVSADEVDGVNDLIDYVNEHGTEVTGMKGDIKANTDAIAAEKQRAEGIEGGLETRLQAVEGKLGAEGDVAGEIADALAEAKGYTDAEVKKLNDGQVATNKSDIAGLKGLVGSTSVDSQIDAKITALKNGQLTTMQGEIDDVEDRVTELEKIDHDHANKSVLDGIEASDITAWDAKVDAVTAAAGTGLKATRTGNNIALDFDNTVTFIFDCGGVPQA